MPCFRACGRGHGGEFGLLLGIAGVAEVFGALAVARLPLRNLALTPVLAWPCSAPSASRSASPRPRSSPPPCSR